MNATPSFLLHLGLDDSAGERDVRQAYARALKQVDQQSQAEQFQALRAAYEQALAWCRRPQAAAAAPPVNYAPAQAAARPPGATAPVMPTAGATLITPAWQTQAQALLPAFLEAVRLLGARPASASEADWDALLADTLAQPALQDLRARPWFEQQIAIRLAEGWRSGHDGLFEAALRHFHWDRERDKLQHFGPCGQLLDQAVLQHAAFHQANPVHAAALEDVIARLRDATPPSQFEANYALGLLPELLARYPQWLAVVTATGNLARWQAMGLYFADGPPALPEPEGEEAAAEARSAAQHGAHHRRIHRWGMALLCLFALIGGLNRLARWQPGDHSAPAAAPGNPASIETYRHQAYPEPAPALATRVEHHIRRYLHYQPPAGFTGNPGVAYKISLSYLGYTLWVERVGTSALPGFDEAIKDAIEHAEPYPAEAPRAMLLTFYLK